MNFSSLWPFLFGEECSMKLISLLIPFFKCCVSYQDQADNCYLLCRLVAHALSALDLEEESAIAVDMPMNVESVIIYLAIVLAGHVVVSIADSFSPREISTRLKISKAKAIFTQVNLS